MTGRNQIIIWEENDIIFVSHLKKKKKKNFVMKYFVPSLCSFSLFSGGHSSDIITTKNKNKK